MGCSCTKFLHILLVCLTTIPLTFWQNTAEMMVDQGGPKVRMVLAAQHLTILGKWIKWTNTTKRQPPNSMFLLCCYTSIRNWCYIIIIGCSSMHKNVVACCWCSILLSCDMKFIYVVQREGTLLLLVNSIKANM